MNETGCTRYDRIFFVWRFPHRSRSSISMSCSAQIPILLYWYMVKMKRKKGQCFYSYRGRSDLVRKDWRTSQAVRLAIVRSLTFMQRSELLGGLSCPARFVRGGYCIHHFATCGRAIIPTYHATRTCTANGFCYVLLWIQKLPPIHACQRMKQRAPATCCLGLRCQGVNRI